MPQQPSASTIASLEPPGRKPVPERRAHGLIWFARQRLREERLPQVAGSLTFTTVLALVPMLTIALAVFTTFPLFNTFRTSLEAYFLRSLMPTSISNTILDYLNQFASKATRLSAVGAVALVLSAMAMMLTIDRAFNHIWRVKSSRPFAQRMIAYWTVVTMGPLLIGFSITLTTSLVAATHGMVGETPFLRSLLSYGVSIALTMLAFALLYATIPNRAVAWRDAIAGGLFASTAFEIAKHIFVVFISKFPTYTVIYGALAAMPIFLVWIFVSWLIILMGAVLTAVLPVVKYERWWHVPAPGDAFIDAMAVLEVLVDARENEGAAVDAATLRRRTRLGFDECDALLDAMYRAGWVAKIQAELSRRIKWSRRLDQGGERWTLLVSPRRLMLSEVYRLFAFHPEGDRQLAEKVERAIEQGLTQTLEGYFASRRAQ
ncbi:tRNA-processing RNAse BN [Noviherbaspirillum humi]|uniref:UPF0761 membrane protein SAMN06265795_11716 n=1 Tax=Noviherbaspirillum humi TaxID=1688639 RepID=A0A239KQ42_9BURK|nr:YihY family inner membrane protein [Noviherbaspirillum humi]SNT20507.1 tRNA-processing RNAse BN [Noviherbaspirillum humi]